MTYREFRNLVLTTLDTQQTFFKSKKMGLPGTEELEKSKSLERLVRKTIKEENAREKERDQGSFEWDTTVPRWE